MYQLKKITVLSIIALFYAYTINAQSFKTASEEVLSKIHLQEINELTADPNLLCINGKDQRVEYKSGTKYVKVGKLLNNGDYSKYYKNKSQVELTRNFYVFIPKEVKEKCIKKGIKDSKRMCRFLGLDDTTPSDTIVFFWIDQSRLFRPAYNSDITKPVSKTNIARSIDHSNSDVQKWFTKECKTNTYPWTRLGYTYDWGDVQDKIGATEFVTRTGFFAEYINYQTVHEFLNQK